MSDQTIRSTSSASSSVSNIFLHVHKHSFSNTGSCGGFCSNCLPLNYIETPRSFQISCLSGRRAVEATNSTGRVRIQQIQVQYDPFLVKKAVHVIRSPFDNIVARFHLEQKRHSRVGDTTWLTAHPNDKVGFQKWCADVDASNELMEARWTDPELSKALKGVPCHAEFFRYIQWHNLAFTTTRDMGIPTFVLHYEDYRDRFESTLEGLLSFLELPHVKKGPPFDIGKEYAEFYTDTQRDAVATLVKELASMESWMHMKDYFAFKSIAREG